eukprot:g29499.t1
MSKLGHVPKPALLRLRKEFKRLQAEPTPGVEAVPLDSNILEWHYVVTGPQDSVYQGGKYHGKLIFPKEYPYKPPSIMIMTPNGRFKLNTRLCMSMSDFHPESWNPLWNVGSILSGLLSFMLEEAPTYGSIVATEAQRRKFAAESLEWNLKNKQFVKLFPHYVKIHQDRTRLRQNLESVAALARDTVQPLQEPLSPTLAPPEKPAAELMMDRLILAVIVVSLAFAISFLYT